MPRAAGLAAVSSFVEVPGDAPAFYHARPVPHGRVHMILYESKAMEVTRYVWVYTPPDYGPFKAVQQPGPENFPNFTSFTKDLLDQIMPTIENSFRVYKDADHRAIGGLSMGAFQSIQIGLAHPELFHYVLAYSGGFDGIGPATPGEIEVQSPWKELLANPEQTKKNVRLLFLGAGQQETSLLPPGKRLVKMFKDKGVNAVWADYPGGHVFSVWRNHLNYTAPMLFR